MDRPLSRIQRPRDIFELGFLFGLGFDTATTVAFLLLTASAAWAGISPLALMALPLRFAAGMTLAGVDLGQAGLLLAGLFLLSWVLASLVHRRRTSLEIPRVSE